jgi:hypothetical protein
MGRVQGSNFFGILGLRQSLTNFVHGRYVATSAPYQEHPPAAYAIIAVGMRPEPPVLPEIFITKSCLSRCWWGPLPPFTKRTSFDTDIMGAARSWN